jgi:hypothetical protein
MSEDFRSVHEGGRPQGQDIQPSGWRTPAGLPRATLDAAARVIRAHADRIAAHWRDDPRADERIGRPIEH